MGSGKHSEGKNTPPAKAKPKTKVKTAAPKKQKKLLGPKKSVPTKVKTEKSKGKSSHRIDGSHESGKSSEGKDVVSRQATAAQQLSYFIHQYESANGVQLSSLELEYMKETCILELSHDQNISNLGEHMKVAFGPSWKEVLCEKHLHEGEIDPGNPALLVISSSAIRSLELLRELQPLTKECQGAKLFSKHMKIDEQVSILKNWVNVASGTPSRIKKLIDMEALGLCRLSVIVLDMHTDVKGYSLFTLPQVRDEFWDLYKSYFRPKLLKGDLRICLYGRTPDVSEIKRKRMQND